MAYPSMSEYNEAIQNPSFVFYDIDLKKCNIALTPLGMPKVASGGFALTYKLTDKSNRWAVRCFHKDVPDLQNRYNEISGQLRKISSSFFVNFEYQSQGIKINNISYPIVKMDWVDGILLNSYIEDNLSNPSVLDNLSHQFRKCVKELENNKIAHGDLQHGNIIICNNQLKLIDYDGMYVQSMQFKSSNEVGHINYQHPLRNPSTIGHELDRFSSIVIYVALEVLKIEPSFWRKYDNGENLLFKRDDFLNPEQSDLILDIRNIPSVKGLIDNFTKICKGSFSSIPSLKEFISGNFNVIPVEVGSVAPVIYRQYAAISTDDIKELLKRKGHVVEIIGHITDVKISWTKNRTKCAFLNFGDYRNKCFVAVIWREGLSYLSKQGIDVETYKDKWVSITALIDGYQGRPEITIDRSIKINILKDKAEAIKILSEANQSAPLRKGDWINRQQILNSRNKEILDSIDNNKLTNNITKAQSTINSHNTSATANAATKSTSRNQDILNQIKSTNKNNIPTTTIKHIINSRNSNKTNAPSNRSNGFPSRNQNMPIYTSNNSSSGKNSDTRCFIATEVYGSFDSPQVLILRQWRDDKLSKSTIGQDFIKFYYKYSPLLVKKLKNKNKIKKVIRKCLDIFIRIILLKR